jgi:hypothetical protein
VTVCFAISNEKTRGANALYLAQRLLCPLHLEIYANRRRCEMAGERIGTIEETLQRVQGEFREMPGLRLTPAQASRLWGLDSVSSQALLDALVDARFLLRTHDGAFMRRADADMMRPRPRSEDGSGTVKSKESLFPTNGSHETPNGTRNLDRLGFVRPR